MSTPSFSSSCRSSRVLYGKANSRGAEERRNSQYLAEFELDPTTGSSSNSSLSYRDDPHHLDNNDTLSPLERGMDSSSRGVTEDIIVFDEHNYMNTQDIVDDESNETLEIVQHKSNGVRRHGVRRCVYVLVAAILISVIITVSVVVPRNKRQQQQQQQQQQPNQSGSGAGGGSSPETTASPTLPPLPPMLKGTCEEGYANREQNAAKYLQCYRLCAMSDCCRLPANAPGSCLTTQSNKFECANYQRACAVLHPNRDSGPGTDANQNGEIDDREADPTAWEDYAGTVDDGDDDDVLFQDDTVTDSTTNVPDPPKTLPTLCSLDKLSHNTGVRVCAEYCRPAACCWGRNGDGVETDGVTCADSAAEVCEKYAPCLNLITHNNVNPQIKDNIDAMCNPASIEAGTNISPNPARVQCKQACQLGQCCFEDGSLIPTDSNCYGKPDGFCAQFQACTILTETTDDDTAADDWADGPNANNGNGNDDTDANGNGNDGGDDDYYYDDAYYDDDAGDNESNQGSDQGGEDTDNVLPPIPPNLNTVCDPELVHSDDETFKQCAKACLPATCCKIPALVPGSCLGNNAETCSLYQFFCGVLDKEYGNAKDVSSTTDLPPVNQSALADVCSPDALSLEWGIEMCTELCQPAACCFDTVDANPSSTVTDLTHCTSNPECANYRSCLNLQATKNAVSSIRDEVDKACSDVSTPEGWNTCQSACLQHKCCVVTDSGDCSGAVDVNACLQYQACKAVFSPSADISAVDAKLQSPNTTNVAGVCEESLIDANDIGKCEAVCAAAECCNLPEGVPGSCLLNSYDDCMVYHKECSVLKLGTDQTSTFEVPEATSDVVGSLVAYCSVASLSTDYGRSKCQALCDPVKCCWSTDLETGDSCRDNTNCPGYAPCLAYASSQTVSGDITHQVESLCSSTSTSTVASPSECRAACIQHRCCWDKSSDICFPKDVCAQYEKCGFLLSFQSP